MLARTLDIRAFAKKTLQQMKEHYVTDQPHDVREADFASLGAALALLTQIPEKDLEKEDRSLLIEIVTLRMKALPGADHTADFNYAKKLSKWIDNSAEDDNNKIFERIGLRFCYEKINKNYPLYEKVYKDLQAMRNTTDEERLRIIRYLELMENREAEILKLIDAISDQSLGILATKAKYAYQLGLKNQEKQLWIEAVKYYTVGLDALAAIGLDQIGQATYQHNLLLTQLSNAKLTCLAHLMKDFKAGSTATQAAFEESKKEDTSTRLQVFSIFERAASNKRKEAPPVTPSTTPTLG